MSRKLKLWALVTTLFFLTACTTVLAEPDKLITPPSGDTAQFQERKVITSLLAEDEHITVPAEMDQPAPSIDVDIDNDGHKEKLVFWLKSNGYQAGITVLKQKSDSVWSVFDQKRVSGRAISYFNMLDFNGDGKNEIFLGADIGGYHTLYIYRPTNSGLELLDQINYSHLTFAELKGEGHPSLICAISNVAGKISTTDLNVYEYNKNEISRSFHQTYDGYCQELNYGFVREKKEGLYLALSADYNSANMMLLLYDGKGFKEELHRESVYVNTLAERSDGLIQDINGDGVLEVLTIRPPVDASKREPREFLQIWRAWNGESDLDPVYAVIENKSDGYRFKLPVKWLENLRYQFIMESGNSQLKLFDGDIKNDKDALLTIFTREADAEIDLNAIKKEYNILGTSPSNQRIYLVKIYKNEFNETDVNESQLKDAFEIEGGQ